jgi:hypothetical protein
LEFKSALPNEFLLSFFFLIHFIRGTTTVLFFLLYKHMDTRILVTLLSIRLYGICKWDEKAIRRLIADGRIAARQKGEESLASASASGATKECPICFLIYTDMNTTTCCHASMCTECFLQVRPQKEKQSTCPFCNCDDFSVVLAKKNISDVPGMCPCETTSDTSGSSSSPASSTANLNLKKKSTASVAPLTPKPEKKTTGFGSELEKDERFKRMRKRSESFASSEGTSTPKKEQEIIQSIAMTVEERQRLEEEMKAQHYHPLVLQLEAEAQERRLENDRAYQSSNSNSNRNLRNQPASEPSTSRGYHLSRRARAARNWEQIASFFDQGEEIEGMTVLETAILFSRFTEGEQGEESYETATNNINNGGSNNSNSNTNSNTNSNNTNREQLEGIPLLRTLLTGQLEGMQGSASPSSSRSLNLRSSRRHRNQFLRSSLGSLRNRERGMGMNDVTLDTASMMMRGISEEEQISMAIAASMQDQQGGADSDDLGDNDDNENNEADGKNEIGSSSSNISSSSSSDSSNSENNRHAGSNSDSTANVTEASSSPPSSIAQIPEASTITELARVVTDSCSPDADTILNGVTA